MPDFFVFGTERGFVEPGEQSMDVFEVDVKEMIGSSSWREHKRLNVANGDAGWSRLQ
jgi:hypothetical protein